MVESTKAKFREKHKEFCEEYFGTDFSKLNDQQKSRGLGLCYLTEIFSKNKPGAVPDTPEEYEECFTDGADDQGVDFFIDASNEHYFIIQIKYRGKRKAEQDSDVSSFKDVIKRLHPVTGESYKKNETLRDNLINIDWPNATFDLLYISLGAGTKDIKNIENEPFNQIDVAELDDINDRATFRFLDETELNQEYRDIVSGNELITVTLRPRHDPSGNPWYAYESEDNLKSFITTLDIAQIYELHKKYRDQLCNLNIRNWIGDNSTNKGIVKTALNSPNRFFFYNNGISAVAKEVSIDKASQELVCKGFSIINGAQTVRSLHKAYLSQSGKPKDEIRQVSVMLRVTEDPRLLTNAELSADITRFNNTQNVVKISDFRSNDPIQVSLHKRFSKKSRGGKKYNYQNKRAKTSTANKINIKLEDFCKTIHAFRFGPIDFFGGLQYLFDDNPDKGYFKLFSDPESNSIADSLDDSRFKIISTDYFVCEAIRTAFDGLKKDRISLAAKSQDDGETKAARVKRALQGRYLIFYVTQIILTEFAKMRGQSLNQFLYAKKMNEPEWQTKEANQRLMEQCVDFACDRIVEDYTNETRSEKFIHRNYHRQLSTLERISDAICVSNVASIKLLSANW